MRKTADYRKTNGMSLSMRVLVVIIPLVFIIIGIALLLISQNVTVNVSKSERENMSQTVLLISRDINNTFFSLENLAVLSAKRNTPINELIAKKKYDLSHKIMIDTVKTNDAIEDVSMIDASGVIVTSSNDYRIGHAITDMNLWKQLIISEKNVMFDFSPYRVEGIKAPLIGLIARMVDSTGNMIGAIAIDINLDRFNNVLTGIGTFGKTGYTAILNKTGLFLAHPDSSMIFNDVSEKEPFIQALISSKDTKGEMTFDIKGKTNNIFFMQTPKYPILVVATIPHSELRILADNVLKSISIAAAVAGIIIVISIFVLFGQLLSKPIAAIEAVVRKSSQGDLTGRVTAARKDELGKLSVSFNGLLDSLEKLIGTMVMRSHDLSSLSLDLAANMEETASSIHEINANINSSKGLITDQAAAVAQTSAALEELTRSIDMLGDMISDQSSAIEESSATIEEMVANIQSVSENSEKAENEMTNLLEFSKGGQKKLDDVINSVRNIGKMSENLIDTTNLIMSISEKTNLLAMNAAIEAAHAGDAGRGFAVVADEIRKLAEQTSAQSKSITQNLNTIKTSIDTVSKSSKDAGESFDGILAKITEVAGIVGQTKQSMSEQKEGSRQILEALKRMNEITETVRKSSAEMTAGNSQILEAETKLTNISAEVKSNIDEISSGTMEINKAVAGVSSLTMQNKKAIDELTKEAGRFTIRAEKKGAPEHQLKDSEINRVVGEPRFIAVPEEETT